MLGDNWESTVIFFTIYFQFVTSAMVFSFGSAFRRPVVFNYRLLVNCSLASPPTPFLNQGLGFLSQTNHSNHKVTYSNCLLDALLTQGSLLLCCACVQGAWTAIITLMSFVLLLPHSSFTHLWHVASEDFNGPNSTSPVWIQYQVIPMQYTLVSCLP